MTLACLKTYKTIFNMYRVKFDIQAYQAVGIFGLNCAWKRSEKYKESRHERMRYLCDLCNYEKHKYHL